MGQTILNLAIPLVTEKIEMILCTYPSHPHQQAFAAPDLRQRLVAYVLTRMPAIYITVDDRQVCAVDSPEGCYSYEQHLQITTLIHQGIDHILKHDHVWVNRHIPEESEPSMTPSNWFG